MSKFDYNILNFDTWSELETHINELGVEMDVAKEDLEFAKKVVLINANRILILSDELHRKEELKINYWILDTCLGTRCKGIYSVGMNANIDGIEYWGVGIWDSKDKTVIRNHYNEDGSFEYGEITLGNYIDDVLVENEKSIKWLEKEIDMDKGELMRQLEDNTLRVVDLIKISNVIDIDFNELKELFNSNEDKVYYPA